MQKYDPKCTHPIRAHFSHNLWSELPQRMIFARRDIPYTWFRSVLHNHLPAGSLCPCNIATFVCLSPFLHAHNAQGDAPCGFRRGGAYNRRGGAYNINMSKIQAYKYSFIRRPNTGHTLLNHHHDTTTVLRQKLDYANRIVTPSGLKSNEKTAAQQKGKVVVEGKGEGQQRVGHEGRQRWLGELVDLLGVVMRHAPALEEYLRLERTRGQETGRDLEREYANAKESLQKERGNRPTTQFTLIKRSVINPERDHHHTHHTRHPTLTIKRAFDLKLPSSTHFTLHPPSRPSLEKQRRGSTGMSTKGEMGSVGQLQVVTEKYRHSQERVRMLEQALRHETGRRDVLIADLNQQVVTGEMALLDAKLRMRSISPHYF